MIIISFLYGLLLHKLQLLTIVIAILFYSYYYCQWSLNIYNGSSGSYLLFTFSILFIFSSFNHLHSYSAHTFTLFLFIFTLSSLPLPFDLLVFLLLSTFFPNRPVFLHFFLPFILSKYYDIAVILLLLLITFMVTVNC